MAAVVGVAPARRAGASRVAALVAVALAGCIALAACGGSGHPPSAARAVSRYLSGVDAVERSLASPLRSVSRVTAELGVRGSHPTVAEADGLMAALRRIEILRARLADLRAPTEAARLRSLLLELVDSEATLTRQTAALVAFLPPFSSALAAISPATSRLARELADNRGTTAAAVAALDARKADALRSFRATIDGVLARLLPLRPPPVSLAGWRAQVSSLRGMAAAAGALAAALSSGSVRTVPALLGRLEAAASATRALTVQRAQRAAIRSYDARLAGLSTLAVAAQQARARLAAKLG